MAQAIRLIPLLLLALILSLGSTAEGAPPKNPRADNKREGAGPPPKPAPTTTTTTTQTGEDKGTWCAKEKTYLKEGWTKERCNKGKEEKTEVSNEQLALLFARIDELELEPGFGRLFVRMQTEISKSKGEAVPPPKPLTRAEVEEMIANTISSLPWWFWPLVIPPWFGLAFIALRNVSLQDRITALEDGRKPKTP